jgi:DNA-binding beta-propeller fold protein YncE
VIDTNTEQVIDTFTANLSPASGVRALAISPEGDTLYVTDSAGDRVVHIDLGTAGQ